MLQEQRLLTSLIALIPADAARLFLPEQILVKGCCHAYPYSPY
jgi:hypothetical protein